MTEFHRVKVVGPDHEVTITDEQLSAQPDAFKVLDKPAVGNDGEPLPPKYKTSVSAEAAKNKAASPASPVTPSPEVAEKAASPASTKEK